MSRICIKNIGKLADEKLLKETFAVKGEITDVRIVKTKSGKSRQMAFIGFRTESQANDAIKYFNNTFLQTARISVEQAQKVGDNSLLENARSRHTKKKMEKIKKANLLLEKSTKENHKKTVVKPVAIMTKEKSEFLNAMKPRREAKFWGNDESIPDVVDGTPSGLDDGADKVTNEDPDGMNSSDESDNSDDGEDVNEFSQPTLRNKPPTKSTIIKTSQNDSIIKPETLIESIPKGSKSTNADMAYLRSKVSGHFSDDEDNASDNNKDDSDNEDDETDSDNDDQQRKTCFNYDDESMVVDEEVAIVKMEKDVDTEVKKSDGADVEVELDETGRLFVRNLTFSCTEDEIRYEILKLIAIWSMT